MSQEKLCKNQVSSKSVRVMLFFVLIWHRMTLMIDYAVNWASLKSLVSIKFLIDITFQGTWTKLTGPDWLQKYLAYQGLLNKACIVEVWPRNQTITLCAQCCHSNMIAILFVLYSNIVNYNVNYNYKDKNWAAFWMPIISHSIDI